MTLVVDASVAIKWMVRENDNDKARALFELPDPLIAPDWLLIEAASALWRKVKQSELLQIHAERHLEDLPEFFSRLHPSQSLVGDALRWSFRLKHPVYDCLYLALAIAQNCKFVTADDKFAHALVGAGLSERLHEW